MSTLFNDVFPSEPLKQVFEYLAATTTSKIELRNYNNFCKQWKFVGQELVRDISVKVKERSLEQLSKNILAFVNRAKSISLVEVDEKKKMPYNIRDQVYYHHAWICILSNDKVDEVDHTEKRSMLYSFITSFLKLSTFKMTKRNYIERLDIFLLSKAAPQLQWRPFLLSEFFPPSIITTPS
ncbi:hypothetical protein BD770DRAFT_407985 [Pilaira anomala]|nr:hypothetical protein BD770DRAFT_407985 [Pilaira anomala]